MQQQSMATYRNNAAIDIVVSSFSSTSSVVCMYFSTIATLSFVSHIFHLVFTVDGMAFLLLLFYLSEPWFWLSCWLCHWHGGSCLSLCHHDFVFVITCCCLLCATPSFILLLSLLFFVIFSNIVAIVLCCCLALVLCNYCHLLLSCWSQFIFI